MRTMPKPPWNRVLVVAGLCTLIFSSGCATVAHGRYQRIRVETEPPAAKVSVEGTQRQSQGALRFETPGEVAVHRKEKHAVVRIEKEGYEPVEIALRRGGSEWTPMGALGFVGLGVSAGMVEGGAAAGLAVGALYGGVTLGIDLLTGSAFRLRPSKISLTLEPEQEDSAGKAP